MAGYAPALQISFAAKKANGRLILQLRDHQSRMIRDEGAARPMNP
jgi:hypothetical protein